MPVDATCIKPRRASCGHRQAPAPWAGRHGGNRMILTAALFAAIFLGFAVMIPKRPAIALAAVLCMFLIDQWAMSGSAYFTQRQTLTNILAGLLVVEGLLFLWLRGQLRLDAIPTVAYWVALLFLWALATVIWSVYREGTIAYWKSQWPYIVVIVLASPLLVRSMDDLRVAMKATALTGGALLLLVLTTREWGVRGLAFHGTIYSTTKAMQFSTPLGLASDAGRLALIAAIAPVMLRRNWWTSLLRWGIVAAGVMVILRTGSRGQLVAFVAAILVFLPLSQGRLSLRGAFITMMSLLVVGLLMMVAVEYFSVEGRLSEERAVEDYATSRLAYSLEALQYWAQSNPIHWLAGYGSSASFHPGILGIYPHVVAVEVLVEEGVIGFAMLLIVAVITLRTGAQALRDRSFDPVNLRLIATLCALILFDLALSFKQASFITTHYLFAFAIIMGRLHLLTRMESAEVWQPDTPDARSAQPVLP